MIPPDPRDAMKLNCFMQKYSLSLSPLYLWARKQFFILRGARYIIRKRMNLILLLDVFNYVDRCVHAFGIYEKSQLRYLSDLIRDSEATLFFDIGAHWGLFSFFLLNRHPGIIINAFEPDSVNFQQFQANLFLNRLGNRIRLYHYAVSDSTRDVYLMPYADENRGRSAIFPGSCENTSASYKQVQAWRLDDLFPMLKARELQSKLMLRDTSFMFCWE